MDQDKNKVFRIQGKVQHYAWGGVSFLPRLLNIPNPENKPYAEYWMGAHENASATIINVDKKDIPLNEYIAKFLQDTLGTPVAKRFGRLPYLLKILDVKDMLSIQVHPSKKNAEKEFADENNRGIDPRAAHRNYKDDNHKPELMLALGDFWLLHGFKPKDKLLQILKLIPELNFLVSAFDKGYAELYQTVMQLQQEEVNTILQPLLNKIIPAYQQNQLKKNDENFWAARAALTFSQPGRIDKGIFSIYLFNLLQLHYGEAIFQDAGLPHAYLEGQNVEIMANSDNVLRGGLTSKHIDVNELMKHVQFEATIPNIIHEKKIAQHIAAFITPAPDFELRKIELKKEEVVSLSSNSTEIFIVLKGKLMINENDQNKFSRKEGEALVSFDKAVFEIKAEEDAVIYFAMVPA